MYIFFFTAPSVQPVPEEERYSPQGSSRENTPPSNVRNKNNTNKKKTRKKRTSTVEESEMEASEENENENETPVMKFNGYTNDSKDNHSGMGNRLIINHPPNDQSLDSVQEVMLTQRFTENESDSDVTTELPATTAVNNRQISRDQDVNQSVDSLQLKNNANLFVNDIMSKAIFEVKRNSLVEDGGHGDQHKHQTDSNAGDFLPGSVSNTERYNINGHTVNKAYINDKNRIKHGHTHLDSEGEESNIHYLPGYANNDDDEEESKREKEAADKRARSVVDQILSNALFVVKNENT